MNKNHEETKAKKPNSHLWVRFFPTGAKCTLWARNRLIAWATSSKTCKRFFKKYGGDKYESA